MNQNALEKLKGHAPFNRNLKKSPIIKDSLIQSIEFLYFIYFYIDMWEK